jgi:DtxR family Mn-dependent transcriptional regulator
MAYPTAIEDYVKVIYGHTEWQAEPITTSVLAARLGLAASSVTEMVKKLVVQGLVEHERYGAVALTPEGTVLALRMVRRHRIIETWLVTRFGYHWDEVHDEAEVLEHALSDRLLDAIDEQLGHPTRDPHGDPIPTTEGTVVRPAAVLLRDAPDGHIGRVVRVSDRDPELLRWLDDNDVALDSEIAADGSLPARALEAIWISVSAPDVELPSP